MYEDTSGPVSALDHRRLAAVGVAGVCAMGLLALTVTLARGIEVQHLDAALRDAVRAPSRGVTYLLLRVLSAPGQRGVLWPGLLVLAALTAHRGRTWRPVLLVAGALLAVAVTVLAIKIGVGRTAPRSGHDLLGAGGRSYPSGHAVNEVVGLALAVSLLTGPGRLLPLRRRPAVLVAVAVAVVAVGGVSLVVADFHWASDVLAGWLLGGALLATGYALQRPARARPPRTPTAGLRPGGRRPSGNPSPPLASATSWKPPASVTASYPPTSSRPAAPACSHPGSHDGPALHPDR